jgi:hypothetical protein
MTRPRGQSSRTLLNRDYPHQVIVSSDGVRGKTLEKVIAFHAQRSIPTKTRSAHQVDRLYTLYCFADLQHALEFRAEFGGDIISQ